MLLTGVKNGVPYAADSAYNIGSGQQGIEKWSKDTPCTVLSDALSIGISNQVSLGKGAKAPAKGKPLRTYICRKLNTASTLKITDASKPSSITVGNGFVVAE